MRVGECIGPVRGETMTLASLLAVFSAGCGPAGDDGVARAPGAPDDGTDAARPLDGAEAGASGRPADLTVCADGAADFAGVQEAVDAAADGDAIAVCAGAFAEPLRVMGKRVTIRGAGAEATVVDAAGLGSALEVLERGAVEVEGLTLRGGLAEVGGGASCADAALALRDVVVRDNEAETGGGVGAVRCVVTVESSSVLDNAARAMGGGLWIEDSLGAVVATRVEGNGAHDGGGVAVVGGSVTLKSNEVRANAAGNHGGAAYVEADGPIAGNRLAGNTAGGGGGGLYLVRGAGVVLENEVVGNWTGVDGGGIYTWNSRAWLARNLVEGNQAVDDAGGLRIFHGHMVVEDNVLRGNAALGGAGGGAKISHATNQLVGNVFEDNVAAEVAGGLEMDDDTSTVEGGAFRRNAAPIGAGLHSTLAWAPFEIRGVVFEDNVAEHCGGGVAIDGDPSEVRLVRVRAVGNAAREGAGICAKDSVVTLVNPILAGNVAEGRGGGALLEGVEGSVVHLVAWGNAAPEGAGLSLNGGTVVVRDGIVAGNVGGSAVEVSGGEPEWIYTDVLGEGAGAAFSGMTDPTGTDGNLAADPAFLDPAAEDFRLDSASPCVDAGSPDEADPDGSRADMGAFGGPNGSWP